MQNINSDLIRGNIDTIILKTMLNGDMYGLDIIREVQNKSNGTYELKQPTLYSCLKRLENQGLISSYWLDSDIGGKRHYYKLTEKGNHDIKSKQTEWSKSKLLIDNLLGDFDSNEYRLVKKDDYDKIINGKPTIKYVSVPISSVGNEEKSPNINNSNLINNQSIKLENQISFEKLYSENINQETDIENNDNINENKNNINEIEIISNNLENDTNIKLIDNNNESLEKNELISNTGLKEENFDNNNFKQTNNFAKDNFENNNNSINNNQDNNFDPYSNEIIFLPKKSNDKQNLDNNNFKTRSFEQTNTFNYTNVLQPKEKETEQKSKNIKNDSFVQQNIFENIFLPYQNEVDNKINEFVSNVSKLNNFNYSGIDEVPQTKQPSNENQKEITPTSNLKSNTIVNLENQSIEGSLPEILSDFEDNQEDNSSNFSDNIAQNDEEIPSEQFTILTSNYKLGELNKLDRDNSIYFENDDGYDNFVNDNNVNLASKNNETQNYVETPSNQPELIYEEINNDDTTKFSKEAIESIIYKNASNYASDNSRDYYASSSMSFSNNFDQEYKNKVQSLSEFAKSSEQEPDEFKSAKDIQTLKEEYKNEGISIKEFNKTHTQSSSKNYILINKLNLIKSFILMFGYIFVLSALYIIMNNTNYKNITDFSFKYFIYGFVPFIIYTIYHLIIYFVNPYKKLSTKFSPRLMIFISIIFTIQLLLITYCVNLQMGFYSFWQIGYNHLLWLIPTLISFAPIVSTIIYSGLYHSRNFNI